jgi:hypothetical protein
MSVEPKPAASDKRTPKDLWNEITVTRSEIDKLLKQSQHTGDLKPVEAALGELQLKTANYRQLIEDMHFRGRKIGDLAEVYAHYASHYREGTALEVMTSVALYFMVSGKRMLADSHLRTKEPSANGGRVLVGCFYKLGFAVFVDYGDHPSSYIGAALARKA